MYNEKQIEWTVEQMVEAAQDALENWDWDNEEKGFEQKMKALIDEGFHGFADEDGIIEIRGFGNVWNWLHEKLSAM